MKKALVAAGLSLTLIVAGAAGSANAAKGGNGKGKSSSPDKYVILTYDEEITVGDDAEVTAVVTREKPSRNTGTVTLALGDGCTGGTISPSPTQNFTFDGSKATDSSSSTWTISGLTVGTCKITVATTQSKGAESGPYSAIASATIKVNAEDGDDVVTGSASWLLSGLAIGLLGLGTGSLMLSRRRMV